MSFSGQREASFHSFVHEIHVFQWGQVRTVQSNSQYEANRLTSRSECNYSTCSEPD